MRQLEGQIVIDPKLDGKVALVTGANHGIGAATSRALAAQGVKVFLTYSRDHSEFAREELDVARAAGVGGLLLYRANQQQTADSVVAEIVAAGGIAAAFETDLSTPEHIPQLFARCEAELGPVDILVNNHTYCAPDTFDAARVSEEGFGIHLISERDVDVNAAVNTRAYVLMMAEFTRRILERGSHWGRIINLSTDAAHAHEANVSYAASKHAIESYSRSAAMELGKYGVTVNIVAPGPIQTGYLTPEQDVAITASTPLSRMGRPEDVADVIVFLASEQARWLTGQLLYVGSGWRMHQ
jgi:3-oxoacyl-[acyl-carrier protein] reductase